MLISVIESPPTREKGIEERKLLGICHCQVRLQQDTSFSGRHDKHLLVLKLIYLYVWIYWAWGPQREQTEKKKGDHSGRRKQTWNLGTTMGDSDKVSEGKVFNDAFNWFLLFPLWQSRQECRSGSVEFFTEAIPDVEMSSEMDAVQNVATWTTISSWQSWNCLSVVYCQCVITCMYKFSKQVSLKGTPAWAFFRGPPQ